MTDSADAINLRRRRLLQAGGVVLCLGRSAFAWGAELLAVRVWPATEYTRVTLESDQKLTWTHQVLQNPDRLLVDIEGLTLSQPLRELVAKVTANDPYIQQVRVGQNRPHVVRLVFDLKGQVLPQVFTLQPVAGYQNRLVFDLYPAHPVDPLMQLVLESEDKQKRLDSALSSNTPTAEAPQEDPIEAIARREAAASAAGTAERASAAASVASQATVAKTPSPVKAPPTLPVGAPSTPSPNTQPKTTRTAKTPSRTGSKMPEHAAPPRLQRLLTVAIDPGHGGEDPGAIGPSGSREKDVVLAIAKKLHQKIEGQANLRAMLTRDADYFVPLHVRVQKARRVQADLFVSIHADAFVQPHASGASVFALSERGASSTTAKWLADKENAADLIGGVNVKTTDKQVAHVLLDLSTTAQIHDSKQVGRAVLGQLGSFQRLHKKDIEQASFAVLKAPDIPSILIETAFISNPEEEVKLNDEAHQERLAEAILKGIQAYFAKHPPLARKALV